MGAGGAARSPPSRPPPSFPSVATLSPPPLKHPPNPSPNTPSNHPHPPSTRLQVAAGSFSNLYRGSYCGQEVAVKILKDIQDDTSQFQEFLQARGAAG